MVVAPLILGVAAPWLAGAYFPEGCPTFLVNEFWVNMGLSIMFFSLSVCFAVKGQNSAFLNTMRLLTWEIRPENPAAYDHDYMKQAQQFEHLGIGQMLRFPGLRTRYGQKSKESRHNQQEHDRQVGPDAGGYRPRPIRGPESAGHPLFDGDEPTLEEVVPQTKHLVYLARFGKFMQLWLPLDTQSKYCIGLGLITLALGASSFSLGMLLASKYWSSDCIGLIMSVIFSYITLVVYRQNFHPKHTLSRVASVTLFLLPPIFSAVAGLIDDPAWVRQIFAPATMLAHCAFFATGFAVSLVEMKPPSYVTKKWTTGPAGQQFPEHLLQDLDQRESGCSSSRCSSDEEAPCAATATGAVIPAKHEEEAATAVRIGARRLVRASLLLAMVLWFCVFVATVLEQYPELALRVAGQDPPDLQILELTSIAWPSASAKPRALACVGDSLFAANEFQVFRISVHEGLARTEPCKTPGLIADVTATCDGRSCWPSVLVTGDGSDPSVVVDCRTGDAMPLLQSVTPAKMVALSPGAATTFPNGTLLALQEDGNLAQFRWAPGQQGWAPLWENGYVGAVSGMDFAGADSITLFWEQETTETGWQVSDVVELRSLQGNRQLGRWRLPAALPQLQAGCALDEDTVLILQGEGPALMRASVRMP
mmetsp:Transcript_17177/g.53064  ORF Transcript_17177/g.53064 Transcript_17177/m.53064 type:complete len:649 (-) Transcript_17177:57-2003(-)